METKKWYIKQLINGITYFNQSFTATKEDYEAFKSLLLLPNEDEIIDYPVFKIKIISIMNLENENKYYFYNVILKQGLNEKNVIKYLKNRVFNNIKVGGIKFFYIYLDYKLPNIIKQGREFEEYVSKHYQKQNYEVIKNYLKEKKDNGIDIIAKKDDELLLIQCKNWEKEIISHKEIKEFLGNCYLFLYKNLEYRKYKKVRRIYVISQSRLDKSAQYLFKEYYPFVEYKKIEFNKNE